MEDSDSKYEKRYHIDDDDWREVSLTRVRYDLGSVYRDVDILIEELDNGFEVTTPYAVFRRKEISNG